MAITGIPEVIKDFNMYLTGNKLAGITGENAVPDLEAMTQTISGAGILGEYETPIPGHFGSLEWEIGFRVINEDYFKMADPTEPLELMLRGSVQVRDAATQKLDEVGMRIVVRGSAKKLAIGTVRQRGAMDSSVTVEITYLLIELDGQKRVELNKLSPTFIVNGVDLLAKTKQLT